MRLLAGAATDVGMVRDGNEDGFLIDDRMDRQTPGQIDAAPAYRARSGDTGGDAAFHVDGASAVEPAVLDVAAERVDRPAADGCPVGQ